MSPNESLHLLSKLQDVSFRSLGCNILYTRKVEDKNPFCLSLSCRSAILYHFLEVSAYLTEKNWLKGLTYLNIRFELR